MSCPTATLAQATSPEPVVHGRRSMVRRTSPRDRRRTGLAVIVLLGLLLIPVECAVAIGPHSIFVAADAVAGLQAKSSGANSPHGDHHRSGDTTPQSVAGTMSLGGHRHAVPGSSWQETDQDPAERSHEQAPPPGHDSGIPRLKSAPPRPAGISADAVVTLDLPGGDPVSLLFHSNTGPPTVFTIPWGHPLSGPEPPPP